jgi:hypothetical protein
MVVMQADAKSEKLEVDLPRVDRCRLIRHFVRVKTNPKFFMVQARSYRIPRGLP